MLGGEKNCEVPSMIVLDTGFIVDYLRGVETTRNLVSEDEDVAVTTITYHEILTSLKRKKSKKEEKFFRKFFSEVRILPFDVKAAEESSGIASRLAAIDREVNAPNILITGVAIANAETTQAGILQNFTRTSPIAITTKWMEELRV